MKVYSQPEVLEDHIAPAVIIPVNPSDFSTLLESGNNVPIGSGSNTVINIGGSVNPILTDIHTGPSLQPEAPSLSDNLSDFNIRTIRVGADSSLFGEPAIDFQDAVLQALIGTATVESTLTDATISLLAEDLSVSNDVIEAIESAVGGDHSAGLVGLSSDEFERTGGSAFLTSL